MQSLNPYIAGNPVGGTPNFVGRADVLREVLRVMRQPHQNIIVLYGQRRIGKTSVLQQLSAQLPNEGNYYPVYFDLQDKATWSLGRVLTELARVLSYELVRQGPPSLKQTGPLLSDVDPVKAFQETWLPATLNRLPEGHSIVLLFDEFDVLADPKGGQAGADLFPYLRGLLATDPDRLQFTFVIGRKVEDLESIALSLFKGAPSLRVSLLNKADTIELMRLSERNESLKWSSEATEKVWDLTHGHPFLTQQLCSRLWENLYDSDPTGIPTVLPDDVERAISETLEASRNTLEWLWDGLPPAERVVISALAGAGDRSITQPQLEQLLRESGVRVVIRELQNAPQLLRDWDLIEPAEDGYRFRVELFRRWILEHKPLSRVQEELDRIEPLAENLYQAAYGFFRSNQLEDAMPLLRQAIGLNPNHARSRQLLAEIFLLRGEVDQAVQILQLLYDTQPSIARPRLVQALLLKTEEEPDEEKRLAIYQQILMVDPTHPLVSQRVAEIQRTARQSELAEQLTGLRSLEGEKRYREALELTRKLAETYPDDRDWPPDLDRLERKTKLADDYQRAIGAWNSGDKETALRGLADVIALEPDYEEATRYLHLAKTGQDAAQLASQLSGEQKAHSRAKTKLDEENLARTEVEKQRNELQIRLENEKEHAAARQRAARRMLFWSVGASLLAVIFLIAFIAFFSRSGVNEANLIAANTALAQAYADLTQIASITPEFSSETPSVDLTEIATEPVTEPPPMTEGDPISPTLEVTETPTPELTPINPYAGPVPELAFARLGKGRILSAALSPDGRRIAIGSAVGLFVYEADTFVEVWYVPIQEGVASVVFSPDSATIAAGTYTIDLRDAATGELRLSLEAQDSVAQALAFSKEGDVLASGTSNGRVTLWNTNDGSIITTLEGDGSKVFALAFSPTANLLAAGTENGTVIVWDLDAGIVQFEWGQHEASVLSLAFSRGGGLLASGGGDSQIKMWDVASQSQADIFGSATMEEAVISLAFSPDDGLLAAGLANGDIVVGDWNSWDIAQTIPAHTDYWVTSLAFYPDGALFSASSDNTAARSNLTSAEVEQRLEGFTSAVRSTAYSPDGNLVATGYENGSIWVWDTATKQPVETLLGTWGSVYALAFWPTDSNILIAGYYNHEVVLWDREVGQPTSLYSHGGWITDLAFSPDGIYLASASEDSTFIVWNMETNQQTFNSEEAHADQVNSVAFSPDGTRLASGSKDGVVNLWEISSGNLIATLTPHSGTEGSIESLAFSSDSRWLASGSTDNTIVVQDLNGEEAPRRLEGHSSTILSVAFSPTDPTLLASGSLDSDVILWDVTTGERRYTFAGHGEQVYSVSFSSNDLILASGSSDGTAVLWDTNPEQIGTLVGEHGEVRSVAFSPQGDVIASAQEDGTISLWNINTGEQNTLSGPSETAFAVAFSPMDGNVLAAGFGNGEILVWNRSSNNPDTPRSLFRHTGAVYSVAFSSDGNFLASGSGDNDILIWDLNTEEEPRLLESHDSSVYSVAFSPTNPDLLISGSEGGTVIIWDVPSRFPLSTLNVDQQGHTDKVFSVAFQDGGNILASASEDAKIILWNTASGDKVGEVADQTSGILSVAFWPNGSFVASGTRDGQLYLSPLAGEDAPIMLSGHTAEIYSLVFSPNGLILASASADGTIILWDIPNILP